MDTRKELIDLHEELSQAINCEFEESITNHTNRMINFIGLIDVYAAQVRAGREEELEDCIELLENNLKEIKKG